MNLFVTHRRAGPGWHLLRDLPVWTSKARYGLMVPRDRVYTLCGYRVPSTMVPSSVTIDGEERPRIVPKIVAGDPTTFLCSKCLQRHDDGVAVFAEIDAVITECREKRLGMLGYHDCWRLWTTITGAT